MPIWSEIGAELGESAVEAVSPDFDAVRRKYLHALHRHSQRDVILYASAWMQKHIPDPRLVAIHDEDIQALMEVSYGLGDEGLDLILHSPGGSIEAAEALVSYLRSRYKHIRVIVPNLAMSAATLMTCAADEIVLGKHSFLGPTDPQVLVQSQFGPKFEPAQAILDQFDLALSQCSDPNKLPVWVPMLGQYGPSLLVQCKSALDLSKELAKSWLHQYMFRRAEDGEEKARRISEWLTNHTEFKSHSRHINRHLLEEQGLNVYRMEQDRDLQDLALSIYHATTYTFAYTPVTKIVENHSGRLFTQLMQYSE